VRLLSLQFSARPVDLLPFPTRRSSDLGAGSGCLARWCSGMGWSPCCWSSPRSRSQAGHEVRSLPSRERADRVPLRAYPASAAATSATEEAAVRLQPSGTYRRRRITFAPSWVPCRAWEGAFFFFFFGAEIVLENVGPGVENHFANLFNPPAGVISRADNLAHRRPLPELERFDLFCLGHASPQFLPETGGLVPKLFQARIRTARSGINLCDRRPIHQVSRVVRRRQLHRPPLD